MSSSASESDGEGDGGACVGCGDWVWNSSDDAGLGSVGKRVIFCCGDRDFRMLTSELCRVPQGWGMRFVRRGRRPGMLAHRRVRPVSMRGQIVRGRLGGWIVGGFWRLVAGGRRRRDVSVALNEWEC